jgi:hypothetical protein
MPSASGLEAWGNFYLVTSAAAATLVGLLFVVLTLAADRMPLSETKRIRLYMTPSVVQLALVLVLAALLTFPTQSRLSTTISCGVIGALGVIYALLVLRGGVRGHSFRELSDVLKYSLLPGVAYIALVAGGLLITALPTPQAGCTCVASGVLALIVLAIRNSWSVAVSVVSFRGRDENS